MLNHIKTFILLTAMTGLLLVAGNMIGGQQGMIIALVIAVAMNFTSYWYSDRIILTMYKARPAERATNPNLYSAVEELCQAGQIPVPAVYIIPSDAPNAFATGRNPKNGAVAVTEGLLRLLDNQEIKGVVAHELSHIKNRDILVQTVAATIAGAVMLLATMARWSALLGGGGRGRRGGGNIIALLAAAIIMPLAAMIVQMSISRSREYLADSGGAEMSGNPLYLARALEKLSSHGRRMKANQATSHLFIVQPFKGKGIQGLFSTHPPVEERVKRLTGRTA